MTVGAVGFDFYDTLVELDRDVPRTWELLGEWGYPIETEIARRYCSDAHDGRLTPRAAAYAGWLEEMTRQLAVRAGVPRRELDDVVERLLASDHQWTVRARPGAGELVRQVRRAGISVGICSNWDHPLEPYLAQADLPDVDWVTLSWEVGARKPNRAFFAEVERASNTRADATVIVGDDLVADCLGARAAGMRAIHLCRAGDCDPSVVCVPTLSDVWEVLERWRSTGSRRVIL